MYAHNKAKKMSQTQENLPASRTKVVECPKCQASMRYTPIQEPEPRFCTQCTTPLHSDSRRVVFKASSPETKVEASTPHVSHTVEVAHFKTSQKAPSKTLSSETLFVEDPNSAAEEPTELGSTLSYTHRSHGSQEATSASSTGSTGQYAPAQVDTEDLGSPTPTDPSDTLEKEHKEEIDLLSQTLSEPVDLSLLQGDRALLLEQTIIDSDLVDLKAELNTTHEELEHKEKTEEEHPLHVQKLKGRLGHEADFIQPNQRVQRHTLSSSVDMSSIIETLRQEEEPQHLAASFQVSNQLKELSVKKVHEHAIDEPPETSSIPEEHSKEATEHIDIQPKRAWEIWLLGGLLWAGVAFLVWKIVSAQS